MRTPANIAGHPIHPMLITLPIGLWVFSFICDLIATGRGPDPWSVIALYTMGGGIIGALLAAVPGLVDLLSLPPGPRRTALTHMGINLSVVVIYVVNFWMRLSNPSRPGLVWLSLLTIVLLVISGWLGGKMVYVYGIGVSEGGQPEERRERTRGHAYGGGE